MLQILDRTAVISGATRGIGREIALKLASHGVRVSFINRNRETAERLSAELEAAGVQSLFVTGSVDDERKCAELAEKTIATFGRIDFVINNAGLTRDNLFLRMKPEEWQEVMNVNLNGVFYLTKACLKSMIKARFGRIICVSSVVGITGNPGQANYCATKAGLIGFTKSLAKELGTRNILCNTIAPGFIETDMTAALNQNQRNKILSGIPLNTMGQGEDIANAVLFLCSPLANYITGETLNVNGGLY